MTTTTLIDTLTAELARLTPEAIDAHSRYVAHDLGADGWRIGYESAGAGEPVIDVTDAAIPAVLERLRALPDGYFDSPTAPTLGTVLAGVDGVMAHA